MRMLRRVVVVKISRIVLLGLRRDIFCPCEETSVCMLHGKAKSTFDVYKHNV